jgi:DNA-binding FrmR family transcriptional regulator
MSQSKRHQTHPDVLKRLKRAEGQLRSVREMIEAGRPCLDVAQQLQAAASAVHEAKKTFINDHLDHCLDNAVAAKGRKARGQMAEFKAITKYL